MFKNMWNRIFAVLVVSLIVTCGTLVIIVGKLVEMYQEVREVFNVWVGSIRWRRVKH